MLPIMTKYRTLNLSLLLFLIVCFSASENEGANKNISNKFSMFLDSFNLANGFNACGTWILAEESCQRVLSDRLVPSITLPFKNSSNSKKLSEYFSHEWSYDELKNTVAFGHLKYSRNCAIGLTMWHSESFVEGGLSQLLWNRFTRPASDYFLFMADGAVHRQKSDILNKISKRSLLNCEHEIGCILENICSHGNPYSITEKCIDFVQGRKFEVAITFAAPLVSYKTLAEGKITGRGVQYKMLETAAQRFNHSFGMHVSIGKGTGSRLPNGSCIGTSGELFHGRGDIGFPLGISLTRQKVMDATTVFEYTRLTFVYRNPSPQSKWEALFWSFPSTVWMSIGFTFIAVIPFIWLILLKEANYNSENKIRESIIFIFAIFLEQDSSLIGNAKMSNAFRIMALTWISGCLILGTAYRSKLVSFLTFPFLEDVPNTFQKLADSDYKVNFKFYGGMAYQGFKTSNVPSFRKIYTRLNVEKDLYKCMESVVLQDKTVCVVYLEAASYMTANNFTLSASSSHSIIGVATEFGMMVPLVFAFPKGSPLTAFYNDIIGIFKASGLHDEWMRKDLIERKKVSVHWLTNSKSKSSAKKVKNKIETFFQNLDPSLKPLFIKNLIGPFALLCIGSVISFLVFVTELLSGQRGRSIICGEISTVVI